jgi:hypothetical protein
MKLRYKLLGGVALCAWLLLAMKGCFDPKPTPGPLPKNDNEQIIVDPNSHHLTIVTAAGPRVITLPDRPSTIDLLKNGDVKITSAQFGFEHHVFAGAVLSDSARLGIGMDGVYYKRLDLGMGIADGFQGSWPVVFAKLTYNVKGNIQAGIVYQSNSFVGGIVSVRLF